MFKVAIGSMTYVTRLPIGYGMRNVTSTVIGLFEFSELILVGGEVTKGERRRGGRTGREGERAGGRMREVRIKGGGLKDEKRTHWREIEKKEGSRRENGKEKGCFFYGEEEGLYK